MSLKGYSKRGIIALCSIVYFVSYFSRKDFAAAMAGMLSSGVIEKSEAGLMGTLMFVFYGVGQLLSGYLGDKFKPQNIIVLGLSTTAACNLVIPFVSSSVMIAVWGINGLAQAMLWPPIVRILSKYLDNETYVKASLIVTSSANAATVVLYLVVPICLTLWSWQIVFLIAGIAAIVSMLVFIALLGAVLPKNESTEAFSDASKRESEKASTPFIKALISSGIVPILFCIVCCGFLRDGIETWLPTLYSEAFGRDASESILVSVLLPIFAITSIVTVTALHKKKLFNNEIRGTILLFALSAALALPIVFMIELESTVTRFICLVLAALICAMMHGVNFLLISCLPGRFVSLGRSSSVGGLVNSFIYVGAAISTYGFAVISKSFGWLETIIVWVAVAILGALLALSSKKKYTSFLTESANKDFKS